MDTLRHERQKSVVTQRHAPFVTRLMSLAGALILSMAWAPEPLAAGLRASVAHQSGGATRTPTPTATATRTRTPTPAPTMTRIAGRSAWKIMPIGDSLTQGGEYAATPHYAYRRPLQTLLAAGGYGFDFVGGQVGPSRPELGAYDDDHEGWVNFSIGGVDTYINESGMRMGITDNITNFLAAQAPDIILLQIGINDIFNPTRVVSPLTVTQRLSRLVDIIGAQRPDALIFLASLTPLPGGVSPEAAALNAHVASLAGNPGDRILYVDLASTSLSGGDWADGVHLSQRGARKIAARWYAAIEAAIAPGTATPTPTAPASPTPGTVTPTPTKPASPTSPPGQYGTLYMPVVVR